MATILQGQQLRQLLLGTQVLKAAAVLPATATATLFTVSGGAVLVTSLLGLCTTVCSATATTLAIGTVPSTGTASTTGLATAVAVTSTEKGTWVGLGATAGAALIVGGANGAGTSAGFGQLAGPASPVAVSAGTISITTSATNTGAFQWYLTYIPLDTGASVA